MKKTFLLIVACTFAFVSAYAQSSEAEIVSQKTKSEQFKTSCSFLKENVLCEFKEAGIKVCTMLYTDLKTKEQLTGIEFIATNVAKELTGMSEHLGYLDMDQLDDFILALETILKEAETTTKHDNCSICYTTPGGIEVYFYSPEGAIGAGSLVAFRKRWIAPNQYGVNQYHYTQNPPIMYTPKLAKLIDSFKEAKNIAKQFNEK